MQFFCKNFIKILKLSSNRESAVGGWAKYRGFWKWAIFSDVSQFSWTKYGVWAKNRDGRFFFLEDLRYCQKAWLHFY